MRVFSNTNNNGTHYVAGETIDTRITIPELHGGNVSNARMKLDIGGGDLSTAALAVSGVGYG